MSNNEISRLEESEERMKQEVHALRDSISQQQQVKEETKSIDAILGLKTLARNVKKITGSSSQDSGDEKKSSSKYVSKK